MPRPARSEAHILLQEVRALEMLMSEVDVPFNRLEDYWELTAELITLSADAEELSARFANPADDERDALALKGRMRSFTSRFALLSME